MSPHARLVIILVLLALATLVLVAYLLAPMPSGPAAPTLPVPTPQATTTPEGGAAPRPSSIPLDEADSAEDSASSVWWLDSGARVMLGPGERIATLAGNLPPLDAWRIYYNNENSADTDNGYHPQNIFRLVSKRSYQNVLQEGYFTIAKDNLSESSNRNESNGVLFMSRYVDQTSLYYAGIRVDGTAVIKKKVSGGPDPENGGTYYTLAQAQIIGEEGAYDRDKNPSLLPKGQRIGLRSSTVTDKDGNVEIAIWVDLDNSGNWKEVLSATDKNGENGGTPILAAGSVGIRTDFMDIVFDEYSATEE